MDQTGLIDSVNLLKLHEKTSLTRLHKSPLAMELQDVQGELAGVLRQVGKTRDPELILQAERAVLTNERQHHAQDKTMRDSLDSALMGVDIALKMLDTVKDPDRYLGVDAALQLPKNRKQDLPRDEARQFFDSNNARLLNLKKARLTPEEKQIIDVRKNNNIIAREQYIRLQRQALGKDIAAGLQQTPIRTL